MLPSLAYFNWSRFSKINEPKTMELPSPNVPTRSRILSNPFPATPTCFWLVVACKISNGGHLRQRFYFCIIFVIQFATPNEKTRPPPHTLCPSRASSPSSIPLLTPNINRLLCLKMKRQPPKANSIFLSLFCFIVQFAAPNKEKKPANMLRPSCTSSP